MSRTKLVIITLEAALFVGCMLFAGWALRDALRTDTGHVSTVRPLHPFPEPEPEEFAEEVVVELPPPRELAIEGRVLTAGSTPFENGAGRGAVVKLGDEAVPLAGDGTFRFAAAVRSRFLPLVFAAEGAGRVELHGLLAGDEVAEAGPQEELLYGPSPFLPGRPARIRWTLVLGPREQPAEKGFWILPGEVFVEDWGMGGRIHVRGESNLPAGAHVYSTLEFDNYRVASSSTDEAGVVEKGEWRAAISISETARLFSGSYEVVASFNLRLEHADVIDTWPPDDFQALASDGTEISRRWRFFAGDPAEAREEDLAVQDYYRPLVVEARALQQALMGRLELVRLLGRGWDPAVIAAYKAAHGAAWFQEVYIGEDGMLDEGRWREFLDVTWRPRVEELLRKHRSRTVAKYTEAESRMADLLDSLLRLSRLYSSLEVYPLFNLPVHEKDFFVDTDGRADIGLLNHRVENNFDRLKRFCELVEE